MVNLAINVVNVKLPEPVTQRMKSELDRSFINIECVQSLEEITDKLDETAYNIVNLPTYLVIGSEVDKICSSMESGQGGYLISFAPDTEFNPDPFIRLVKNQIFDYVMSQVEIATGVNSSRYVQ